MLKSEFWKYNADGASCLHRGHPTHKWGEGPKNIVYPSKEYNQMRIRHTRIEKASSLGFAQGKFFEEACEDVKSTRAVDFCDANPGYEKRISRYLKKAFESADFVPRKFSDIRRYSKSKHEMVCDIKSGRNPISYIDKTKSMMIILRGGEERFNNGIGLSADHTYAICPIFHGSVLSSEKGYRQVLVIGSIHRASNNIYRFFVNRA